MQYVTNHLDGEVTEGCQEAFKFRQSLVNTGLRVPQCSSVGSNARHLSFAATAQVTVQLIDGVNRRLQLRQRLPVHTQT